MVESCNQNFLSAIGYRFILSRAPNIEYNIQKIDMPGLSSNFAQSPTPFNNQPFTPDKIEYDTLNITFLLDESLQTYLEIYNWLIGITFPKSFDQYKTLADASQSSNETLYSDISVSILTNSNNPQYNFAFKNCFPISLSGWNFDASLTEIIPIECTTSFKYSHFEIDVVS